MTVSGKWFANGLKHASQGDIIWGSDTIKVAAFPHSASISQTTPEFFSDLAGELGTANGYTAGGATLAGKSVVLTSLTVSLRASATTWTPGAGQTLAIGFLIVYKSTGTGSTSPLLGFVDLGADVSATNANWTATWDATDGVLKITAS